MEDILCQFSCILIGLFLILTLELSGILAVEVLNSLANLGHELLFINGEEKNLIFGVRAEHISIDKKGIKAEVNFVEILGNTTNIICKLENSEAEFSISVQERSELVAGDKIHVNFDIKNCHLFDKESEASIYKYGSEE